MYRKLLFIPLVFVCFFVLIIPVSAYKIPFTENSLLEFKGELVYSVKVRTEDPDPFLLDQDFLSSKSNSNFEKGDLVNNKGFVKLEATFDMPHLTLFFLGETFYDRVYDDDDKYIEGADIDEARRYAALGYEAREYYLDFYTRKFTFRVGRQIVEWGELVGSFFAPGVGVINLMDGSRIGAAGYSFRDYKVASLMAWAVYEITNYWSIDAVYAPDFDPRYAMPVVGTYGSFLDMGGFGAPEKGMMGVPLDDGRPTKFEDMQQYGGSTKLIFPSLGNLDLTFYYFHYLSWMPMINVDMTVFEMKTEYPDMDMYGLSFVTAVEFGLGIELDGELAYRPNEPYMVIAAGGLPLPSGYERARTLNWGIGGSKSISNFLSFTPWDILFDPMFSLYGANNLDYNKEIDDGKKAWGAPERTVYYMVAGQFSTYQIIDNTYLNLMLMFTGALHKEMDTVHSIGATLTAKYGDSLKFMFGYDYKMGDPEQTLGGPFSTVDRDAFSFAITLYLI